MNKADWIMKYRPLVNKSGELISYDVVEDLEFIGQQDSNKVWTEMWDFDSETPFLVAGCVLDEDGGLAWYLCNLAWVEDDWDVVQWVED
jgi:hypothetical protein